VHSVSAILPTAIFASSFSNVPDAACSPDHFHNIVLIICQFSTVLLQFLFQTVHIPTIIIIIIIIFRLSELNQAQ